MDLHYFTLSIRSDETIILLFVKYTCDQKNHHLVGKKKTIKRQCYTCKIYQFSNIFSGYLKFAKPMKR